MNPAAGLLVLRKTANAHALLNERCALFDCGTKNFLVGGLLPLLNLSLHVGRKLPLHPLLNRGSGAESENVLRV